MSDAKIVPFSPVMAMCQPFVLLPEKDIPPREWLYAPWCLREFVSVLHGPGGVGKTSLYLTEALAIATNRNLLGVQPAKSEPVWILNLEDPRNEMQRRVQAVARRWAITNEQLRNRLFIDGAPLLPFRIARRTIDGVEPDQPTIDAVVSKIRQNMIGLLIVDPFSASHGVGESANEEINDVVNIWKGIAALTKCAVLLVHHHKKGAVDMEAPGDAARGASALIDAARTARALQAMTIDDAARYAIDEGERRQHVRIIGSKTNVTTLGAPTWVKLTSMHLDNGDAVQAVEPWKLPGASDGIDPEALDAVVADLAQRGPQRANPQAGNWFGWQLADLLNLEGASERSKAARQRAMKLIDQLAKAGRIRRRVIEEGRKERPVWEAVSGPDQRLGK